MVAKSDRIYVQTDENLRKELDGFMKLNNHVFRSRQDLFRFMIKNLNVFADNSSVISDTKSIRILELEKELIEKNNELIFLKKEMDKIKVGSDIDKKIDDLTELVEIVEVIVSSDFLVTNDIKGSKSTSVYQKAKMEVERLKTKENDSLAREVESGIKKERANLFSKNN